MTLTSWLLALDRLACRLRARELSGGEWQTEIDRLFGLAPLAPIHAHADVAALLAEMRRHRFREQGDLFVALPPEGGFVGPSGAARFKLAHVAKGRGIAPHGHENMVSAFLCLSGTFRVRSYERLHAGPDCWELRLAAEQPAGGPGSWSSVSDERHNVHWLEALTDDAFLLTTKLTALDPARPHVSRVYLDLAKAERGPQDRIRAPVIEKREAGLRY